MLMARLHLSPETVWRLPPSGIYAAHQTIAATVDGAALWRADGSEALVLSERAPRDTPVWRVAQTKPFDPQLRRGDALTFSIRANATVSRDGKRHDLVVDAVKRGDSRPQREIAAEIYPAWIRRQGDRCGFEVADVVAGRRVRHVGVRRGADLTFWTVDLDGVLVVRDPDLVRATLLSGLGHARAFGAGLLLVARTH